jgi:lysozyme
MPTTPPPAGATALAEALIRVNEGFSAAPYKDVAGVWTIGSGLTRLNGVAVTGNTAPITKAQDDAALGYELAQTRTLLGSTVKVPLADHEWAALASFAYNVGGRQFGTSTLLRLLNQGNRVGAAKEFAKWNIAGGRVVQGLVNRRKREAAMFLGEDVPGVTPDEVPDPALVAAVKAVLAAGGAVTGLDAAVAAARG